MQVVSGPIGKERLHYEAPVAARLRGEMKEFLDWFEKESSTDLVLKAGVAHLWFVTIRSTGQRLCIKKRYEFCVSVA
jgi:Fic family protein